MSEAKLTHVGGPTLLVEVDGWRILTDPTFDPPGGKYNFGWGTSSRKTAGPAVAAVDIGPGELWISGDTVLYPGATAVAGRLDVGTAIVHLGGVRFPISGPLRCTMTGTQAADLCRRLAPATVVPIHYDGWSHFREDRAAAESEFATGLAGGPTIAWLEPGAPSSIEV